MSHRSGRKPERNAVLLPLFDAQGRLVEALEGAVRSDDHEEVDGLLGDAMRKIAQARCANRELQRKRLGQPTIAETA